MPKTKEQLREEWVELCNKEWDAICKDQPVITVGLVDSNGDICEINQVDIKDVGTLDRIVSDMKLKRFYDSLINV